MSKEAVVKVPEVVEELQVDVKASAETHDFYKVSELSGKDVTKGEKIVAVPKAGLKGEFHKWKRYIEMEISELKADNKVLKADNEEFKADNKVLKADNKVFKADNKELKSWRKELKSWKKEAQGREALLFCREYVLQMKLPIIATHFGTSPYWLRRANRLQHFGALFNEQNRLVVKQGRSDEEEDFVLRVNKVKDKYGDSVSDIKSWRKLKDDRDDFAHPDLDEVDFTEVIPRLTLEDGFKEALSKIIQEFPIGSNDE